MPVSVISSNLQSPQPVSKQCEHVSVCFETSNQRFVAGFGVALTVVFDRGANWVRIGICQANSQCPCCIRGSASKLTAAKQTMSRVRVMMKFIRLPTACEVSDPNPKTPELLTVHKVVSVLSC